MQSSIQQFWNILFKRDIVKKEDLLREIIRVFKTKYIAEQQGIYFDENEKEALFCFMKEHADNKNLGFFPGDRDLFAELFFTGQTLHIIDFVIETYKNDYTGTIISPEYLTKHLGGYIHFMDADSILVNEAEKFLIGLEEFVNKSEEKQFSFTTSNYLMFEMLNLAFIYKSNVKVKHASLYLPLELEEKYDLIISIPAFAGKVGNNNKSFLTNITTGIAIENQSKLLNEGGKLIVVAPASFTFSSATRIVREWILDNFNLETIYELPEGTFRPYTGIKTYILEISNNNQIEDIMVGKNILSDKDLICIDYELISSERFREFTDWRLDLLMAENKHELKKYRESTLPKVKLKELAEVFRGKSIMKNNLKPGDIFVLNISNIEDGEIIFDTMETIDEDERKIKRYELHENDLLITCRGTVPKIAVFNKSNKKVIASANIIVIRFKDKIKSEYVKIFLESPFGTELVKTFQRGTTVMNINPKDISELEIPIISLEKQIELVNNYNSEKNLYKESLKEASNRWNQNKNDIYNSLL